MCLFKKLDGEWMNRFCVPAKKNNISRCHFHGAYLCGALVHVSKDKYMKRQPEQQICLWEKGKIPSV